jgi:predicted RNase H-like nuclease (RuvC/YqgF family)
MPSPEPSSPDASPVPAGSDSATFAEALADVEQSLQDLKARYAQVEQDEQQQADLRQTRDRLQQQLSQTQRADQKAALKAELQQLQTRLDELEFNLESRLFTWGSLREVFWQILRFGGLGVAIGWLLAFATIQAPKPTPAPNPPPLQSPVP